ncbi:MAG: amidinotransferase [Mucilaginibacter sp.]|nr:amidinotransferase [Mucilaginibacter sp.]
MSQTTSTILMIRPVNFGFNEQTAGSNAFQNRSVAQQQVQDKALTEFDNLVNVLQENGVEVIVIDDTPEPHTPDSIFPNNWVSFHQDGNVFLYPMMAENRRLERREDIIMQLEDEFKIKHVIDLSRFEHENKFLEGTGSMVLDRENKIAYACLSPRTNKEVLDLFCSQSGYKSVLFHAVDENGLDIYHTNVLMCIGSKFAVICLDSIADGKEKAEVIASLNATHKEIVAISFAQMNHFAGNMLELKNKAGENLLVMSQNAYRSLNEDQKTTLQKYCKLLYADINTIENNGGGSARCMIAEVHLPHDL